MPQGLHEQQGRNSVTQKSSPLFFVFVWIIPSHPSSLSHDPSLPSQPPSVRAYVDDEEQGGNAPSYQVSRSTEPCHDDGGVADSRCRLLRQR